jgi:hypothetical protein
MVLIVERSHEDTKALQPHGIPRLKIYKHFTHSKSRSFYAISNALQGKASLLHSL